MFISTLNCEMWPNFGYRGVRSVQLLLLLLLLMVFSSENFGFSPPYAGIAGIGPRCKNGLSYQIFGFLKNMSDLPIGSSPGSTIWL